MPNKNITKFAFIVILMGSMALSQTGCSIVSPSSSTQNDGFDTPRYGNPVVTGTLQSKDLREASGVAASKCQADVYWTHNDSGDDAFIFALNKKGEKLGTWKVTGAKANDWEDIAEIKTPAGECVLYIGDIGNNTRIRDEFTIYRVREPKVLPENESSSKKNPLPTEGAEAIKFVYPDMRHDAETLMVHPTSGDIYILSKRLSGASAVYKLKSDFDLSKTNKLEKLADFSVPAIPNGFLTGGDIAPDGRRVIICDYFSAYELVLPETAKNFDEIWKETPQAVELGPREQGEAITYSADGKSIIAGSENKKPPLIEVKRK